MRRHAVAMPEGDGLAALEVADVLEAKGPTSGKEVRKPVDRSAVALRLAPAPVERSGPLLDAAMRW